MEYVNHVWAWKRASWKGGSVGGRVREYTDVNYVAHVMWGVARTRLAHPN